MVGKVAVKVVVATADTGVMLVGQMVVARVVNTAVTTVAAEVVGMVVEMRADPAAVGVRVHRTRPPRR